MAASLKQIQKRAQAKYLNSLEQKWAENQIHCACYHAFYGSLPQEFAPVLAKAIRETPKGDLGALLKRIPGLVTRFQEGVDAEMGMTHESQPEVESI